MSFTKGFVRRRRARHVLGLLLGAALLAGCAGIPREARERGRRAGLPWAENSEDWSVVALPGPGAVEQAEGMLAALAQPSVLLFAEDGRIPGHWELLAKLAAELLRRGSAGDGPGQILLLQEGEHALGWLVHDYVRGVRDSLPPLMRRQDRRGIDRLREIQADRQQIEYHSVGINRKPGSLQLSLHVIGAELGEMPLFVDVLEAEAGGADYAAAVRELADLLSDPEGGLSQRLGEAHGARWYARIVDILQVELRSIELRGTADSVAGRRAIGAVIRRQLEDYMQKLHASRQTAPPGPYPSPRHTPSPRRQLIANTRYYPELHRGSEYYRIGVLSDAPDSPAASLPPDFPAYLLYPARAILFAHKEHQ